MNTEIDTQTHIHTLIRLVIHHLMGKRSHFHQIPNLWIGQTSIHHKICIAFLKTFINHIFIFLCNLTITFIGDDHTHSHNFELDGALMRIHCHTSIVMIMLFVENSTKCQPIFVHFKHIYTHPNGSLLFYYFFEAFSCSYG